MKLARVIGRVVATRKHESLEGLALLLVQPVDEAGAKIGHPIVAFDTARAGEGDLVFFEGGKEGAQANPNGWFNPADAAILGIVDRVDAPSRNSEGRGALKGTPNRSDSAPRNSEGREALNGTPNRNDSAPRDSEGVSR